MNNTTFVSNARAFEALKIAYIWGMKGQLATEALLQQCIAEAKRSGRYSFTAAKIAYARKNVIALGRRAGDCSWLLTGSADIPVEGSATIWDECHDKGAISAIPNIPGLVVYRSGHIGIYLGGGWVIESGGYSKGVIFSKINEPATGSAWTGYGKWKHIDYVFAEWCVSRVLKPQDPNQTGEDVRSLQSALTSAGYPCGKIDGSFGDMTEASVRAFQQDHPECGTNGKPDGKAGRLTITELGGTCTA